jgi:hypothetical protein
VEAILHIGAEKTGSTTVQVALSKSRDQLLRNGVLYPRAFGEANHVALYCFASEGPMDELKGQLGLRTENDRVEFRRRMREALEAEISSGRRLHMILFSNEHSSSRLRKRDELERIKTLLSPFVQTFRVILYIRPQWHLAASLYSTYVKTGGTKPFHFPDSAVLSSKFDYRRVIMLWRSVFGENAVIVRRFQRTALRGSDVLEDFIDAAGLPNDIERVVPQNVRLCAAGTEFLRLFNSRVPRTIDFKFNELRGNIQGLLESYNSGRAFVPDPEVIDRIRNWSGMSTIGFLKMYSVETQRFSRRTRIMSATGMVIALT